MKYFTSEWWASGGENAEVLFEQYSSYLASVRTQLPSELVAFNAEHTLHDSKIKNIACDFRTQTVTMELDGWNLKFDCRVHYTIQFSGVMLFDQQIPQKEPLDDLGYWEFEALDSATEVRMLFASSAEFRIVFTGFSFEHVRQKV